MVNQRPLRVEVVAECLRLNREELRARGVFDWMNHAGRCREKDIAGIRLADFDLLPGAEPELNVFAGFKF